MAEKTRGFKSIGELSVEERKKIALETAAAYFPGSKLAVVKVGAYCSLYRIKKGGPILKVSSKQRIGLEALFYKVLQKRNVFVIQARRLTDYVLCMEDLTASKKWRLATKKDLSKGTVGKACAFWYQAFHDAGRAELKENPHLASILKWEYAGLHKEALDYATEIFALQDHPVWRRAVHAFPSFIDYLKPKVDTFTYNDFYYVNLAVSRTREAEIILFDFDHSGKGLAESDYNNIAYSLDGEALKNFLEVMPVDGGLLAVDDVLSLLFGLVTGAQRIVKPKWALELIKYLDTEEYRANLEKACTFW